MKVPAPLADSSRSAVVAALRREVQKLEGGRPPADERALSTGSPDLDRLLPERGLRRGWLVEYLAAQPGCGAGALALAAAWQACSEGRSLVVMDRGRQFYPPAAAAWGIDLDRLLIIQPASEAEELWAMDQALRCTGVGAVWSPCSRLAVHDFRRLQLAAECGDTLGVLIRPARVRGQPTWSEIQWLVEPAAGSPHPHWRLRVELVRSRHGGAGRAVLLEWNESLRLWQQSNHHATHPRNPSAELARAATMRFA